MRAIIVTMIIFYIITFIFGEFITNVIFSSGGITASYANPIYLGIILLSGLIVGCTLYIVEEIKKSKKNNGE